MTIEQMQARIAQLEAEKAERDAKGTGIKIGEKGGVSVYGLGARPVTLYIGQWVVLLSKAATILAFLKANFNNPRLAFKSDEQRAELAAKLGIAVPTPEVSATEQPSA